MLLLDPDISYVTFVLCYRDDEEESKAYIGDIFCNLPRGVSVTKIKLGETVLYTIGVMRLFCAHSNLSDHAHPYRPN